jgi:nucleoside-diphosphate-sugar epimerase
MNVFVTGGSGFIGAAFVRAAVAAGWDVRALARSSASAERLRALGATAVDGDVLDESGAWRAAAADADTVAHVAQPQTYGGRITGKRARRWRDERLQMDRALLSALDPARVQRVVYVAGTSYYGDCGADVPHDEDVTPRPRGWGPYIAPALDALRAHIDRGLPVVQAFPGWVYGPGSWFAEYVLTPLHAGKRVTGLSGRARITSLVHVDDCARALVHLLTAGEPGRRYFVVDDAPAENDRPARAAAAALGVPFRSRSVHPLICRLLLGRIVTESLQYENRLSNARLRATGFEPQFPTYEHGVPDVVATWLRETAATNGQRGASTVSST